MQRLAAEFLSADYLFLAVGVVGGACSDVSQSFFEVAQFAKREKLVSILQDLQSSGESAAAEKTLIFVEQKKNADFLATYLCQADVSLSCNLFNQALFGVGSMLPQWPQGARRRDSRNLWPALLRIPDLNLCILALTSVSHHIYPRRPVAARARRGVGRL